MTNRHGGKHDDEWDIKDEPGKGWNATTHGLQEALGYFTMTCCEQTECEAGCILSVV